MRTAKFIKGEKEPNPHLCNYCYDQPATCIASELKFGSGVGDDNVIECDAFEPFTDVTEFIIIEENELDAEV